MKQATRRRFTITITVLALAVLPALAAACAIGSVQLKVMDTLRLLLAKIPLIGSAVDISDISTAQAGIIYNLRLPRSLLALLAGGTLAVCGCGLQSLFRNPLAEPGVLGISSGAALGAAAAVVGLDALGLGMLSIIVGSFIGGLLGVGITYIAAGAAGRVSNTRLLLAGVASSSLLSALTSVLLIFNYDKLERVVLWTMGSFATATWAKLAWAAPVMLIGSLLLLTRGRTLNILLLDEDAAASLGVNVDGQKRITLLLTALSTAAAVSVSGIIGFVGLMVPHAARILTGPDNRTLMPVSFLGGALFMLGVDVLARVMISPLEIPVGIITAAIGGPFFLYLLRKARL